MEAQRLSNLFEVTQLEPRPDFNAQLFLGDSEIWRPNDSVSQNTVQLSDFKNCLRTLQENSKQVSGIQESNAPREIKQWDKEGMWGKPGSRDLERPSHLADHWELKKCPHFMITCNVWTNAAPAGSLGYQLPDGQSLLPSTVCSFLASFQ